MLQAGTGGCGRAGYLVLSASKLVNGAALVGWQ